MPVVFDWSDCIDFTPCHFFKELRRMPRLQTTVGTPDARSLVYELLSLLYRLLDDRFHMLVHARVANLNLTTATLVVGTTK